MKKYYQKKEHSNSLVIIVLEIVLKVWLKKHVNIRKRLITANIVWFKKQVLLCPIRTAHTWELLGATELLWDAVNMLDTDSKCCPNQRTWISWFPTGKINDQAWLGSIVALDKVCVYLFFSKLYASVVNMFRIPTLSLDKWHLISAQCNLIYLIFYVNVSCHIKHNVWFHMPYHKLPNKLSLNYVSWLSFLCFFSAKRTDK